MIKASICVPTMNRSKFIIRMLDYYNSLKSPHPIYIGDSSNSFHKKQIENKVKELKNKLEIYYFHWPKYNDVKALEEVVEGKHSEQLIS